MSLNCPHAWEEYKKLDTAYDDLRRQYFALRGEQTEFSNVPKDWLVKMRELRGRCLDFGKEKDDFLDNNVLFEKIKLQNLQKKIANNIELSKRDLRFMYSIDRWPSVETKDALEEIIETRNKSKELSKILGCSKDQISFSQEEFIDSKDIIYHWGNLHFRNTNAYDFDLKLPKYVRGYFFPDNLKSAEGLVLPEKIGGDLDLRSLISADGLVFSKEIGGDLRLTSLTSAEGLVLPEKIGGDLSLTSLTSAEGLVLPKEIGGDIYLRGLISAKGLVLPEKICGDLKLNGLTSAEGLVLQKEIGGNLDLDGLTSAEGLVLPEKIGSLYLKGLTSAEGLVLPKEIGGSLNLENLISIEGLVLPKELGGSLYLAGLTDAKGLVLPTFIQGELNLNGLENADDLDLSNRIIVGQITLLSLPEDEKDKLRAKYPSFAKKIK